MPILSFDQVCLAYGVKPLLADVSFTINEGEKLCLLGRNGEGKSSLLNLVCDDIQPDSGRIWRMSGIKTGVLQQDLPVEDDSDVFDVVSGGLDGVGELLSEYHHLSQQEMTDRTIDRLAKIQHQIEAVDGWSLNNQVDTIIEKLSLPKDARMADLSGGWKRRVLLARALVANPDLLILDEPTNHLDIPAIKWLEARLKTFRGAILFVSHDRSFIRALSSKIIELDRGSLTEWNGTYDDYLINKEKWLEEEARRNALFDKKLSDEEKWIRKGIKARRTRNEGRVRALKQLRVERSRRIDRVGNVNLNLEQARTSGKIVVEARAISFGYDENAMVIRDFSTMIMRKDRIGLIGENGCGKSTLIKLLLGSLKPVKGRIKQGTNLEVAYFDQSREALNGELSVADNVSEGREFIEINGKSKHVMGYLNEFLFTSERARTPVSALSGGEKNRLLLAKLFSKPSNVLVLDEPTNDLDVETLELLEDALTSYDGTIIITSHDRYFLDSVVTSTIAFEGEGKVREYIGGYTDWVRQGRGFPSEQDVGKAGKTNAEGSAEPATEAASPAARPRPKRASKLSYKLKTELASLPEKIEAIEKRKADLEAIVADPSFYQKEHDEVSDTLSRLAETESEMEGLLDRWVELEALSE
ncbi:MAG: ABC transporter ATP-binding protein [Proteobacteria bacterium]|nr:MAG: ABC transporter ATP-binding protein [Pseudomonadota bacterium]